MHKVMRTSGKRPISYLQIGFFRLQRGDLLLVQLVLPLVSQLHIPSKLLEAGLRFPSPLCPLINLLPKRCDCGGLGWTWTGGGGTRSSAATVCTDIRRSPLCNRRRGRPRRCRSKHGEISALRATEATKQQRR